MKYMDNFQFTTSATNNLTSNQAFRANGIFDPDYTGAGHQPLGHDQWNTFYNHYLVVGSKISVTMVPSVATGNGMTLIGCWLTANANLPTTNMTEMMEKNRGMFQLDYLRNTRCKRVVCKYSPRKFFNVKDTKDNLTRIGASFGANPSDVAIFNVIYGQNFMGAAIPIQCVVCIKYIVLLSEPKNLPTS